MAQRTRAKKPGTKTAKTRGTTTSGRPRIVLIGGGSYSWMPTIVRDLVVTEELEGSTLVLEDIDSKALKDLSRLSDKIIRGSGRKFNLEATTSLTRALKGADYVVVTISTGGYDTMEHDLNVPLKYGIYQAVGDTVGPGGLSRALRNIPVMAGIARDMEKICPQAWLINISNPMTTLCRSVTKTTGIRTIGLCHELFGTMRRIADMLGVENWRKECRFRVAGVNHFIWILELKVNGRDGFEMLRRAIDDPGCAAQLKKGKKFTREELSNFTHQLGSNQVKFELFKIYGALPACGDRHIAEFFPYFLTESAHAGKDFGVGLTTIEDRRANWRPNDIRKYHEFMAGTRPIKYEKSGEAVSDVINALSGGAPCYDVLNLPNQGQIPELPQNAVVETMGFVTRDSARGLTAGPVPPGVLAHLHRHVINQEMTVEAALTGDRNLALQVLLQDPLVTRDFRDAKKMLDELLENNRKYLPRFFKQ